MAWSHWSSRLAMNDLPSPPEGLAVFFWRCSRYSFSSLLRSALELVARLGDQPQHLVRVLLIIFLEEEVVALDHRIDHPDRFIASWPCSRARAPWPPDRGA